MTPRSRSLIAALVLAAISAALAGSAQAAWPGADGPVLFRVYNNSDKGHSYSYEGIWSARLGEPFSAVKKLETKRYDANPQVSPDGRLVVFSRYALHGLGLYWMDAEDDHVVRFTNGAAYADAEASFAPSGKRVIFSRCRLVDEKCRLGRGGDGDIYSIRLDGSGLRHLTFGLANDLNPTFSPTGKLIAFERGGRILTMRPDGSRLRNLVLPLNQNRHVFEPDFSPDGSRIAFIDGVKGLGGKIFTIRPNGSSLRRLSPPSGGERQLPFSGLSYSPTGRRLVAVRNVSNPGSSLRHELQVIDARTGQVRGQRFHTRGRVIFTPVWAPEARPSPR
jgi:Tol biopolymer transport system component